MFYHIISRIILQEFEMFFLSSSKRFQKKHVHLKQYFVSYARIVRWRYTMKDIEKCFDACALENTSFQNMVS